MDIGTQSLHWLAKHLCREVTSSLSERISRMDAILFAMALEVVLLQMRVHEGSTKLRIAGFSMLNKTGQIQYEKLVRDRELVKDVVRRTLVEVGETGGWRSLQLALEKLQECIFSPLTKRKEHEQLKLTREETMNELTSKRNQWIVKLRNADYKSALLRDKMKDNVLNAKLRLRYTELWLSARLEAQELRYQMERKTGPMPKAEHENRVHEEITKAIELQIQEREKAVEYWKQRYAVDIVSINERLAQKRWQLAVASAKREELQNLYDLHEGEMRAWRTFKEHRANRLAREERARNAATHIQAWWRGTMVRKALGPFKFLRNIKKSPSKSKKK